MRGYDKCKICGAFYLRICLRCPICDSQAIVPRTCWTEDEVRQWGEND